jgi:hypothetical protein
VGTFLRRQFGSTPINQFQSNFVDKSRGSTYLVF